MIFSVANMTSGTSCSVGVVAQGITPTVRNPDGFKGVRSQCWGLSRVEPPSVHTSMVKHNGLCLEMPHPQFTLIMKNL